MKRAATAIALFALLALPLLASGPGGGMGSSPMPSSMQQQKSPHDQAVDYFNNAERRIDGLSKTHDEMKAALTGDPQKAVDYGAAHGALAMTTPGDTSMADKAEVEKLMKGGGARVQR